MEAGIVNFIIDLYLKLFQRLIVFSLNLFLNTIQTVLLKFNFVLYEEKETVIKQKKVNNKLLNVRTRLKVGKWGGGQTFSRARKLFFKTVIKCSKNVLFSLYSYFQNKSIKQ